MSPVGIPNACICALSGESETSWFGDAGVAPLRTRRGSQGPRLSPRAKLLLDCDDRCMLSVPSSTNDLNNSRWQSGEICQVFSIGAFTLFCHVYDVTMDSSLSVHACLLPPHVRKHVLSSSFVILVLLSCSRVCLLDVSRLLGLTLRHSAPVCCCHRDSLTRWRLAFAQGSRVISDSSRGMSLQEKWTYEGPASLVISFFTHCATYLLPLSQFSII